MNFNALKTTPALDECFVMIFLKIFSDLDESLFFLREPAGERKKLEMSQVEKIYKRNLQSTNCSWSRFKGVKMNYSIKEK